MAALCGRVTSWACSAGCRPVQKAAESSRKQPKAAENGRQRAFPDLSGLPAEFPLQLQASRRSLHKHMQIAHVRNPSLGSVPCMAAQAASHVGRLHPSVESQEPRLNAKGLTKLGQDASGSVAGGSVGSGSKGGSSSTGKGIFEVSRRFGLSHVVIPSLLSLNNQLSLICFLNVCMCNSIYNHINLIQFRYILIFHRCLD